MLNDFLGVEHNSDGTLKTNGSLAGKQPLNNTLTTIAGLVPVNNDVLQLKNGAWTNRTPGQLKTDLSLVKADVGLGNVDNTSDVNKPISNPAQTALNTKATKPTTGRNELTGWFHISGYPGADPTGATDSTAAVQQCYADAAAAAGANLSSVTSSGATVYIDGQYVVSSPIVYPNNVHTLGNGREISRLWNNTTDLFAWGAGQFPQKVSWCNVALETGPLGGHVFNYTGGAGVGGLAQAQFINCTIRSRNTSSSLFKWRGNGQYIGVTIDGCDLDAQASRTVPAIDMLVDSGNLINSNVWKESWCRGHNTSAAPFFFIQPTNGGYCYNNTFKDLVGEQNGGGFIHLYACDGVVVENCPDWDLVGSYTDHVYKFAVAPSTTAACKNVRIENSYRLSSGGLGSGVSDIYAVPNNPSTATNSTIRIVHCNPPGLALTATLNGSVQVDHLTQSYKIITGTYTISSLDPDIIICNSASPFTVTLPAATNSLNGRKFTIKNVGAGTVTISGTVDGAASPTLGQWAKATYMTDGTNAALGRIWFTV